MNINSIINKNNRQIFQIKAENPEELENCKEMVKLCDSNFFNLDFDDFELPTGLSIYLGSYPK